MRHWFKGSLQISTTWKGSNVSFIKQRNKCAPFGPHLIPTYHRSSSSSAATPLYDVAVIGGGITGTAAAVAMTTSSIAKNLRILLVDAGPKKQMWPQEQTPLSKTSIHPPFTNRVSTITLGNARFLEKIGVWNRVLSRRAQPFDKMFVWDATTTSQLTFYSKEVGEDCFGYVVENAVLSDSLLETLQEHCTPSVHVLHNTMLRQLELPPFVNKGSSSRDGYAVLHLQHTSSTEPTHSTVGARLVIGADGPHSHVRTQANLSSHGWDYTQHGIVATHNVHYASLRNSSSVSSLPAFQRFLPSGPIALLPLSDHSSSLVWSVPPSWSSHLMACSEEQFTQLVKMAFMASVADVYAAMNALTSPSPIDPLNSPPFFSESERLLCLDSNLSSHSFPLPKISSTEPTSRACFPYRFRHSPRMVAENVALVGDAARSIHVLAGQGLNLGLGDVRCLIEHMEKWILTGHSPENPFMLCEYARERLKATLPMMFTVDALYRIFSSPISNLSILQNMRKLGMLTIEHFPSLKHQLIEVAMR